MKRCRQDHEAAVTASGCDLLLDFRDGRGGTHNDPGGPQHVVGICNYLLSEQMSKNHIYSFNSGQATWSLTLRIFG